MRLLRVIIAAMAILLVGLAAGCSSDSGSGADNDSSGYTEPDKAFARLEPATFAERMKREDVVLINVHIPYEGELEQTDAFIPYDKILDDPQLPKDKDSEILLYCRSGRMSEEAGAALDKAGYTNISHLEGGMNGWEAAGRPLIQNPAHAAGTPAGMPAHG